MTPETCCSGWYAGSSAGRNSAWPCNATAGPHATIMIRIFVTVRSVGPQPQANLKRFLTAIQATSAQELYAEVEDEALLVVAARAEFVARRGEEDEPVSQLPAHAEVQQRVRLVGRVGLVQLEQSFALRAAGGR